jgi:hypothetical protein
MLHWNEGAICTTGHVQLLIQHLKNGKSVNIRQNSFSLLMTDNDGGWPSIVFQFWATLWNFSELAISQRKCSASFEPQRFKLTYVHS